MFCQKLFIIHERRSTLTKASIKLFWHYIVIIFYYLYFTTGNKALFLIQFDSFAPYPFYFNGSFTLIVFSFFSKALNYYISNFTLARLMPFSLIFLQQQCEKLPREIKCGKMGWIAFDKILALWQSLIQLQHTRMCSWFHFCYCSVMAAFIFGTCPFVKDCKCPNLRSLHL